jgi:sec-independent protein translocase protein TatA
MGAFGWPHLLIILAVILLLFGAAKLPALAKSMGQSARVFRGEMKAMKDDDASRAGADAAQGVADATSPSASAEASAGTGGAPDPKS